jgi:hypothetical protein
MLVMDRVRHAAILPSKMTPRSGPKQCSQNIQKNRCRTTVAEPSGETLAELSFTGDQAICLGHDQAAWSGPQVQSLSWRSGAKPNTATVGKSGGSALPAGLPSYSEGTSSPNEEIAESISSLTRGAHKNEGSEGNYSGRYREIPQATLDRRSPMDCPYK